MKQLSALRAIDGVKFARAVRRTTNLIKFYHQDPKFLTTRVILDSLLDSTLRSQPQVRKQL